MGLRPTRGGEGPAGHGAGDRAALAGHPLLPFSRRLSHLRAENHSATDCWATAPFPLQVTLCVRVEGGAVGQENMLVCVVTPASGE